MKVFIAGDLVPKNRTTSLFQQKKTKELLGDVISLTQEADISIVNLEAPIISKEPTPIKKSGPVLSAPINTLSVIKESGFNVITLANNHFRDQGQQGVETTIKLAIDNSVDFVGGGRDLQEARRVLYKKIGTEVLAIVNVCENEFSIASSEYGGSNPLNIIDTYNDIIESKRKADYVMLIVHGGIEMYQFPTPRMKKLYHFFADAGANIIVNHHQHCYSGYEVYKQCPIFYGLGNFCFDWEGRENDSLWNKGYAVSFILNKGNVTFQLHPYIQCSLFVGVQLIASQEYNNEIEKINKIILNDDALEKTFQSYVKLNEKNMMIRISPNRNRLINYMYRKGFIKSLFPKSKLLQIKNMYYCESHSELLKAVLHNLTHN